jgi:F420-0:gamma-glutamyl ligase-like protein
MCGEADETTYHVALECAYLKNERCSTLGFEKVTQEYGWGSIGALIDFLQDPGVAMLETEMSVMPEEGHREQQERLLEEAAQYFGRDSVIFVVDEQVAADILGVNITAREHGSDATVAEIEAWARLCQMRQGQRAARFLQRLGDRPTPAGVTQTVMTGVSRGD